MIRQEVYLRARACRRPPVDLVDSIVLLVLRTERSGLGLLRHGELEAVSRRVDAGKLRAT